MKTFTLCNGQVLTSGGLKKTNVIIEDGKISSIVEGESRGEKIDCTGLYVLPGFRDQHLHDLPSCLSGLNVDKVGRIAASLAKHGVTSAKLATIAMPRNSLIKYVETVRDYMLSPRNGVDGARIDGVNVEGTFIRRECGGAQPREYIVEPWMPEAKPLLEDLAAVGGVKLVNIVADFGSDLIEYASSMGFIVGCGHSKASAKQLEEAYKRGLKYIVHVTNGSMGQSFKPFDGGGTYEGALILPLFIEIIVDGYHVDMRYVSDIIERKIQKGLGNKLIAVTDASFIVEEEIPRGGFQILSVVGYKPPDENVLFVKKFLDVDGEWKEPAKNTLFGSLLTMDKAFENLLNLFTVDHEGFMIDAKARGFVEALKIASDMTSHNQAILEGLNNVGYIAEGCVADLVVLDISGKPGKYNVKVVKTIVNGNLHDFSETRG